MWKISLKRIYAHVYHKTAYRLTNSKRLRCQYKNAYSYCGVDSQAFKKHFSILLCTDFYSSTCKSNEKRVMKAAHYRINSLYYIRLVMIKSWKTWKNTNWLNSRYACTSYMKIHSCLSLQLIFFCCKDIVLQCLFHLLNEQVKGKTGSFVLDGLWQGNFRIKLIDFTARQRQCTIHAARDSK